MRLFKKKKWLKKLKEDLGIKEETPEDRFRKLFNPTELNHKATELSKKLLDVELSKADVNYQIKLETQFEKDYPGRKAIWRGKPTGLFKVWLREHDVFDAYFEDERYS